MKIFIPLTDDLLDQLSPDQTLVPYTLGAPLLSQLEEVPAAEAGGTSRDAIPERRQPGPKALPPSPN